MSRLGAAISSSENVAQGLLLPEGGGEVCSARERPRTNQLHPASVRPA